jgi:hypothetical protein
MKQSRDKPTELSLGMIGRGRHANRWLKVAALSFAVTGCDAFVEGKAGKHSSALGSAENPPLDAAENPTPDAENPDAENPTPDAENPENPDAENPTPDAENPENPITAR